MAKTSDTGPWPPQRLAWEDLRYPNWSGSRSTFELGQSGFVNGTYPDRLPRYWRYHEKDGARSYQRSPVPPDSTVTIAGASTPEDIAGTSEASKSLLTFHNNLRAQFGNGPLKWNATMAERGVEWATACKWEHWDDDNLSMMFTGTKGEATTVDNYVAMWANEWEGYDFDHPEKEAGSHFTAMVWKDHTDVGCAWAVCPDPGWTNKVVFRCQYSLGGNMAWNQGQFYAKNVVKWINQDGFTPSK